MHIQPKSIVFFALTFFLSASSVFAQNQFKMPDMDRTTDTNSSATGPISSQAKTSKPPQENRQSLPPVSPRSLFKNDLRANSGDRNPPTTAKFDSQPLPPQPRSRQSGTTNFSDTESSPPSSPTVGKFSPQPQNTIQPIQNLNPIQRLNPNRLTENVHLNQTGSALPAGPRQSLPPVDQRSEITARNTIDQTSNYTIPVVKQSVPRQSVIAAQIPSIGQDHSHVTRATHTNPIQQYQNQQRPRQNVQESKPDHARKLLQQFDVSSSTRPLPGLPVTLKDLMQTTPLPYRHAMVQQYWETYFDWATLNNAVEFSKWLGQLPNPRMPAEVKMMQTAKSIAKNDMVAAEIQLSKSQAKLQQLSRFKTQDLLPLPLNQPLVSKYKTHYEWYASRNLIPEKLKGIDEMLPRTFELLELRAATAQQAKNVCNQFKSAMNNGQTSIGDVLESGRIWQNATQSYVSTVVNYNRAIADYALTIAPKQKPLDQIVSMLVAKPKSINEIAERNSVLERPTRQNNFANANAGQQQPLVPSNNNSVRQANNSFANGNNQRFNGQKQQVRNNKAADLSPQINNATNNERSRQITSPDQGFRRQGAIRQQAQQTSPATEFRNPNTTANNNATFKAAPTKKQPTKTTGKTGNSFQGATGGGGFKTGSSGGNFQAGGALGR